MQFAKLTMATALGAALAATGALADMQGTGLSGGWEKRTAVKPDPSKVVVPEGYEVGIFVASHRQSS